MSFTFFAAWINTQNENAHRADFFNPAISIALWITNAWQPTVVASYIYSHTGARSAHTYTHTHVYTAQSWATQLGAMHRIELELHQTHTIAISLASLAAYFKCIHRGRGALQRAIRCTSTHGHGTYTIHWCELGCAIDKLEIMSARRTVFRRMHKFNQPDAVAPQMAKRNCRTPCTAPSQTHTHTILADGPLCKRIIYQRS